MTRLPSVVVSVFLFMPMSSTASDLDHCRLHRLGYVFFERSRSRVLTLFSGEMAVLRFVGYRFKLFWFVHWFLYLLSIANR